MLEGVYVDTIMNHNTTRPYPQQPQEVSGITIGQDAIYRYSLPDSDYPTLIIVEPLYDDDKNFIPPGYYELALNDEQNFMLLIQSKNPVAIIPVFKVEVDANEKEMLNNILPEKELEKFRGAYLDIAQTIKEIQNNNNAEGTISEEEYAKLENIDFEYVLFSSALIDYDYIMALISQYTSMKNSEKEYVTQKELIKSLLRSTSNLIDESKDIIDYVETLKIGEPLTKEQIEEGYKQYKQIKINEEIEKIVKEFQLKYHDVKDFVDNIIRRMRIDSDELTELFEDRDLGWKESGALEDSFMHRLIPVINKLANGNTIRGLEVYDNNQ